MTMYWFSITTELILDLVTQDTGCMIINIFQGTWYNIKSYTKCIIYDKYVY